MRGIIDYAVVYDISSDRERAKIDKLSHSKPDREVHLDIDEAFL